jgi:hypothetical protein
LRITRKLRMFLYWSFIFSFLIFWVPPSHPHAFHPSVKNTDKAMYV